MSDRSGKIDTGVLAGVCVGLAIVIGFAAFVLLDTTGREGSGLGQEFVYDVSELGKVDEELILYNESSVFETGFDVSRAIAIDAEETLYVVGDKSIRIFNSSGVFDREISLDDGPRCIEVLPDKVFIGMKEHVEVYDKAGQKLSAWESLGQRAVLTSIDVYKGNIFVADAGNRAVVRYDIKGRIQNFIGKKEAERNIPGFVIPSHNFDLAVGADGLLRVVNPGRHRIEAYTFDGDLEFWWGKASMAIEGFCGCCNPANFAILSDDSFITSEKGLVRVKVYDADGEFVGVVAGPEQLFRGGAAHIGETVAEAQAGGFDVAVNENGKVFVLDTIKNVVKTFVKKDN
jgi:hypothetical protein